MPTRRGRNSLPTCRRWRPSRWACLADRSVDPPIHQLIRQSANQPINRSAMPARLRPQRCSEPLAPGACQSGIDTRLRQRLLCGLGFLRAAPFARTNHEAARQHTCRIGGEKVGDGQTHRPHPLPHRDRSAPAGPQRGSVCVRAAPALPRRRRESRHRRRHRRSADPASARALHAAPSARRGLNQTSGPDGQSSPFSLSSGAGLRR